jgi:hypothetical protein
VTDPVSQAAGIVLDAGAFIALERRDRVMTHLAKRLADARTPLVTSAGVVAQVWRGAHQQVPIAFLLRRTIVVDLTNAAAKTVGRFLAVTGTSDPIDAHIVLLAREREWPVLTSDVEELRAIDPTLELHPI